MAKKRKRKPVEADNRAMEVIDAIRALKRISKTRLAVFMGCRSQYYKQMHSNDIMVTSLKKYAVLLGCEVILRDRESGAEWRV